MAPPSFGIFDHIEDIPGTPTHRLLQDRLELIRLADEGGFAGYHLAEHHGSDLCMAPNQELFIAAAAQVAQTLSESAPVEPLELAHGLATQRLFSSTIAAVECELRDGMLHLPDGPGLGVEIDEDALDAHRL